MNIISLCDIDFSLYMIKQTKKKVWYVYYLKGWQNNYRAFSRGRLISRRVLCSKRPFQIEIICLNVYCNLRLR